jgi:tRNA pseudouridine38-40 synthase
MRFAIGIEYDGTNYYGWQRQENVGSIQEKIENALSKVADEPISLTCAGRTDRGVHALLQVAHFDTTKERNNHSWLLGTNGNLPRDIRIIWIRQAPYDFHARYHATSRHYRYVIYNQKVASALLHNHALWCHKPLDEKLMNEAGRFLLGEHDFSSFRGSGCQSKSAKRNVTLLEITRSENIINIDIKANAFLLHMVRNIVGVLLKIGVGEKAPIWAKEVLEARDRKKAAITVPACGLYLVKVYYGDILMSDMTD